MTQENSLNDLCGAVKTSCYLQNAEHSWYSDRQFLNLVIKAKICHQPFASFEKFEIKLFCHIGNHDLPDPTRKRSDYFQSHSELSACFVCQWFENLHLPMLHLPSNSFRGEVLKRLPIQISVCHETLTMCTMILRPGTWSHNDAPISILAHRLSQDLRIGHELPDEQDRRVEFT
jgi:hypothetical protein